MTLTMARGPLSTSRPDTVNYRVEGPEHLLLFDEFPRRVRGVLGGTTVADTTRGRLLHESALLPVLYFPDSDVNSAVLEPTDHQTYCPFKGDASYWNVRVGDRVAENAVWAYPDPFPAASWLRGWMAFDWGVIDEWFDEDERVVGHLRDPYHRVDVRDSSRHVRVLWGDTVIAETHEPKLLSETGLPNHFYIAPADVGDGLLERSDTQTVCPYKGIATYWSVRVGDTQVTDAAWSYEVPLENAIKVPGYLCFSHSDLTVEVDGKPAG